MIDYAELVKDLKEWPRICVEYEGSIDELHDKSADAIEELVGRAKVLEKVADKWCEAVPKWIPVKEQLPKYGDFVIVAIKDERGDTPYTYSDYGWYFNHAKCWIVDNEQRDDVYAWMPLPKPPEE